MKAKGLRHCGSNPGRVRTGTVLAALLILCGCQQLEQTPAEVQLTKVEATLIAAIDDLQRTVIASRSEVAALEAHQSAARMDLENRLNQLEAGVFEIPSQLTALCETEQTPAETCEPVQTVVVSADKMLVGELEHVWMDPPGASVVARIDTGATSSSLNAANVVSFERDGEDWVRFDVQFDQTEPVTVERAVIRHARVIQQADPGGSRRPVVEMRVRLGDVQSTFEFTLADRSHLENDMILGRNFLADVTLVDVGRQFIQPRFDPSILTD